MFGGNAQDIDDIFRGKLSKIAGFGGVSGIIPSCLRWHGLYTKLLGNKC